MGKIFKALVIAIVAAVVTGCSNDLEFSGAGTGNYVHKMVIDDIPIRPEEWKELWFEDTVTGDRWLDRMYCDIEIRELTSSVISGGAFETYFKYTDDAGVYAQEELPVTVYKREAAEPLDWSYAMNCEYSAGYLRVTMRTSDFKPYRPDETLYFRMVVFY